VRPRLDAGANRQGQDPFEGLALVLRACLIKGIEHRLQLDAFRNRLLSRGDVARDESLGVGVHCSMVLPYGRVVMSTPEHPVTKAIRKQRYEEAMRDLPTHVARRWVQMPKTSNTGMAMAWLRFQKMSEIEQMAVFIALYRRSNVLAIDRANQLADAHASVATHTGDTPAA